MNFTLRQLRALAAVARASSFTRAAAQLHVSQPALTVQIRELEGILGLKLLDRSTRSVRLSAIGRELLPVFERVLAELDAVSGNARDLAAGNRGVVRVAALPSLCATIIPAAIARLKVTHPGITVRIEDTPARRILALVASEEADIGIGGFGKLGAEFESRALMRDHMVAVMPRGHRLAQGASPTLKALAREPLVFMDSQSSVRAIVESALAGRDVTPAFEVTYMSTAVGLVRAGLGIAILPSSAVELELGGVIARSISRSPLRRDIAMVRKRARSLSPAAGLLMETVATAATPGRARRSP